ncbi:hypothetical protein [Roseospirillum parvum]|uniref:hypothetical protein n=1 Tax=Roseospirillum parvum TaxID=83401 RepID=UPI00116037A7|nr:hypothetical protein [Roseospirillum parvum]
MSWLATLWGAASGVWRRLALIAAAVLAVALVLARARRDGAVAERAAARARILRIKERQQDARAAVPRDRRGVAQRLRDGSF